MNLQEQNILFFTRTMQLGGTENVILQLCEIFKPLVNKIVVCSCGGINVEKIEKMGIKHILIEDIENKSFPIMLKVIKSLKKIIKDEKISVIHTHHRMAAFYISLLRLYRDCIFINTSHNTFYDKKFLTKFAYKQGHLIACGQMVKKNLVDVFGLPENQVTVIHNAVKAFDGNVKKDFLIEEMHEKGFFVVGNIGRLSEQKGMEYFIKAIPEVMQKCPNTRFVIVGSGEEEEMLKQLSNELEVDEYLTFLGYREDIQNLMSQIDLIVLSSLWEGLPLTPIEAFSVGKTIVATAVDGTVEIVDDGVDGCLISPKQSKQIADKIIWFIDNDDIRRKMESNSLIHYRNEFSFEKLKSNYCSYYERL